MCKLILLLCILIYTQPCLNINPESDWGFYGHRLINRLAVFTLPPELIGFYKNNIGYISDHAVDPDKRRYTVKAEAIRHYIDLDHWLNSDNDKLPCDYALAMLTYSEITIHRTQDSFPLFEKYISNLDTTGQLHFSDQVIAQYSPFECSISSAQFRKLFYSKILPDYDPDYWFTELQALSEFFEIKPGSEIIHILDTFSKHGILPYHFIKVYKQLTAAFIEKNTSKILRFSAEIGHYLGDAYVPLHTSKNYNGQLTNQIGIHAFWESRIPELFAEQDFDFVVGPAAFIEDINHFIWNVIHESHSFVPYLLHKEKELSQSYPYDKQYCFERRGSAILKLPCKKYAELYYQSLDDQVEQRMRKCILNLGSVWMSAWIEAGQPLLDKAASDLQPLNYTEPSDSAQEQIFIPARNHE